MLNELVSKCRTFRRFYEDEVISTKDLRELVDLARLTASIANSQVLKFRLCNTPEETVKVFQTLHWAGALPDWDGPKKGHLMISS